MNIQFEASRRAIIKSSVFGLMAASIPNISYAKNFLERTDSNFKLKRNPGKYFPNIDPEIVAEVVGKSHFNLDRVKELVDQRPELARSTWEWQFGDFESAIGAASHVGRRDIALYLIGKGARPTLFTFAMLGAFHVVKHVIGYHPGIQHTMGPHGISLLQHAKAGKRMIETMAIKEKKDLIRLIDYLESLGDADGESYLEVNPQDQEKYLGDYKYGDGPNDGFTIQLNMRNMLSLGKIGKFGGALNKIGDNRFTYNGAPSVLITFKMEDDLVKSLTIHEPEMFLTATKI